MLLLRIVAIVCGLLAFFGIRWAYVTYIVVGLLYFPLLVGFRFHPHACQLALSPDLALMSLANWGHIVLFAIFFVMTMVQFGRRTPSAFAWSAVIVLAMGALVEIAEGATGARNCRLRDLVPDAAGAILGMVIVASVGRMRGR